MRRGRTHHTKLPCNSILIVVRAFLLMTRALLLPYPLDSCASAYRYGASRFRPVSQAPRGSPPPRLVCAGTCSMMCNRRSTDPSGADGYAGGARRPQVRIWNDKGSALGPRRSRGRFTTGWSWRSMLTSRLERAGHDRETVARTPRGRT